MFSREDMVALCIIFIGIFVRVYTLPSQSIWYDEFLCVANLDASTWSDYNEEFRVFDPYLPPLYHWILYWWARLVGTNVIVMRMPSLFFGLCSLCMMWILGKSLIGARYSLFSLALFAFSPQQIYHAQGIRCYSLVVLLSLMSAFTFLRMLHDDKWLWWLVNAISNALLLWTHWICFLLVAAWGVGILLWLRYPKKIIVWGLIHVLSVFPLILIIINTIRVHLIEGQGESVQISSLQILAAVLTFPFFRDALDVISALPSDYAMKMGYTTSFEFYSKYLVAGSSIVLALLFLKAVIVSSFGGIVKWTFRGAFVMDAEPGVASISLKDGDSNVHAAVDSLPFLLLWFFIPSLLLLAPAYAINFTVIIPRYTVSVAPSLHLLTALHLKRMRSKRWAFCFGLCILLCIVSLGISTTLLSVRGNYLGVGKIIASNYDGRPIGAIGDMGVEKMTAYNAHLSADAIVRLFSIEEISTWLSKAARNNEKVWLIYESMDAAFEDMSLFNSIERLLARENINYLKYFFNGAEILVVFDITF